MWHPRTALVLLVFLIIVTVMIGSAICVPAAKLDGTQLQRNDSQDDVEKSLDKFLQLYYDKFIRQQVDAEVQELEQQNKQRMRKKDDEEVVEDIYDRMQGDQPNNMMEGHNNHIEQNFGNFSIDPNDNSTEFYHALRIKKQNIWLDHLKDQILHQIGRDNVSSQSKPVPTANQNLPNLTDFLPHLMNLSSTLSDDQITEKIRSFYPSCDKNVDTDHELWKDENTMNLYFNFDYGTDQKAPNIATATLRLYRLPSTNNSELNVKSSDCDFNLTEDEKLIRVSIYWYTKSNRKRRVKRRLSDSKVISENTKWVELCVKPATKAWSRGKNFGLGISVEDQEGNALKADKYFKGPSCMLLRNQSQPSSSMLQEIRTNYTKFIAYWEEIQLQPYIVTYSCYQ